MKIGTIPLLHPYNNTPCNRFWDGYFNFSDRQWMVLHSKEKEIQVVEIHNPRARSLNVLKIFLLFTGIVPLIAGIYYLIKVCNYRNYHVTLVTPQEKPKVHQVAQMQIREPNEEIATLTVMPIEQANLDKPNEIAPLNALQNLEKVSFKQYQKHPLFPNIYPKELFPNIKWLEVDFEDINENSLPFLHSVRGIRFAFKGAFENNDATQNLIRNHGKELVSLFQAHPDALLKFLHMASQFEDQILLHEELFKRLFIHLSKMTEEDLGTLFELYGTFLERKNNQTREKKVKLNLLDLLPPDNLFPFIIKAKGDCKVLLKLLCQLTPQYTCQNIKETIDQNPDLFDSIFQKIHHIKEETDQVYAFVLVSYISSGRILNGPNSFIDLITHFKTSKFIRKILAVSDVPFIEYDESFINNLKALFLHKKLKPHNRLKFIEAFSDQRLIAPWILEFILKDYPEFRTTCLEPWADEIFINAWKEIKKEWRAYLLFVDCYKSMDKKPLNVVSTLLNNRPKDFNASLFKNQMWYPGLMAIEFIHTLNTDVRAKPPPIEDRFYSSFASLLGEITPLEQVEKMLQCIPEGEAPKFVASFVSSSLKNRDEEFNKKVLEEILPNFKKYVGYDNQAFKSFLTAIDSPDKLEWVLDSLGKLSAARSYKFQSILSAGIFYYVENVHHTMHVNLSRETIIKIFRKKNLKPSDEEVFLEGLTFDLYYKA